MSTLEHVLLDIILICVGLPMATLFLVFVFMFIMGFIR